MEDTLLRLIESLESTLSILQGPVGHELQSALHDHDKLPDKKIAGLAARSLDLLHETEQLLEPASLVLADHFLGHVDSKCLTAAVELDVPDALGNTPLTIEELSSTCGARPDRLFQVMRNLCGRNIFSYDRFTHRFANNRVSTLLLSTHWTQWRNWVDLYGNEFYDIGRGIPASLRKDTTRLAAQIQFDTDDDIFTYFAKQPGLTPRFHRALTGAAVAQAPGILADYPWDAFAGHTFLDIGGGAGAHVALVLRNHPTVHAGVLDIAPVIAQAAANFHAAGGEFADVGDRVSPENLIAGNYLEEIPPFKIYTVKWCLHNVDDVGAVALMTNVRRAIIVDDKDEPGVSRFVILEAILSDTHSGRLSRYADVTMMTSCPGMERDEAHWRRLAGECGWIVREIYPLRNAWVVAIEMVPDPSWKEDTTT